MRIDEAIEVFGRGFSFTRSFTHPYLFERVGPLWVMRDTPRKRPEYRNEEWLVYGVPFCEAEAVIQQNRRERYAVCAVTALGDPTEPIKQEFKASGYRFLGTEGLFAHSLEQIPSFACEFAVQQVADEATAERLAKAAGTRQVRRQDLAASPVVLRQYMALDAEEPVGWVRSIACGEASWCSNMYVKAPYRRQGIGKALMARMLQGDQACGLKASVLAASHVGAMLYPVVGYEQIGQLMIFVPIRK